MPESKPVQQLYTELRQLAYEDPIEAKRQFIALYESDHADLHALLLLMSSSGDGRLRQIIARAVQKRPDRSRIADMLIQWQVSETDEFALTAIKDALEGTPGRLRIPKTSEEMPDLAATFRYLSSRLRHKVLNVLPLTGLSVDDLREVILELDAGSSTHSILTRLDDLQASLRRLERAMDFNEEVGYFAQNRLLLPEWLRLYAPRFQSYYGTIKLQIDFGTIADDAWIRASSFLLETIFDNLWVNSQQATAGICTITVIGRTHGANLIVTVIDNGEGYLAEDRERAFELRYTTKGGTERGRGHLEIADAVRRLGGTAKVKQVYQNGFRPVLTLPRVKI
jgi:signal transduction histidine kinase